MNAPNGYRERRQLERGTGGSEPTRPQLVSMILGTFREMPGLSLHMNQAARLFGVKQTTCAVVLEDLVAQGKLRRGADGQYVGGQLDRMIPGPPSPIPGQHTFTDPRRRH